LTVPRPSAKSLKRTRKPPHHKTQNEAAKVRIPVAGIGASAGGLEAFTELLKSLPTNTGIAFVLVQHLDPKHESILPDILSRTTKMPVLPAQNDLRVAANHVYIIGPGTSLTIANGVLQVSKRKVEQGRHMPIDVFLQSLAEDQKTSAIGIILSGTASDGVLGLRSIKAEGGAPDFSPGVWK
jgi:two-component system CheB/CheR fusion protein